MMSKNTNLLRKYISFAPSKSNLSEMTKKQKKEKAKKDARAQKI